MPRQAFHSVAPSPLLSPQTPLLSLQAYPFVSPSSTLASPSSPFVLPKSPFVSPGPPLSPRAQARGLPLGRRLTGGSLALRLGVTKLRLGATAKGLTQKHFWNSLHWGGWSKQKEKLEWKARTKTIWNQSLWTSPFLSSYSLIFWWL